MNIDAYQHRTYKSPACTNMTRYTNITHITTLSRKEQEDIRRIMAQCRLTDGLSLSCPETDRYWPGGGRHCGCFPGCV